MTTTDEQIALLEKDVAEMHLVLWKEGLLDKYANLSVAVPNRALAQICQSVLLRYHHALVGDVEPKPACRQLGEPFGYRITASGSLIEDNANFEALIHLIGLAKDLYLDEYDLATEMKKSEFPPPTGKTWTTRHVKDILWDVRTPGHPLYSATTNELLICVEVPILKGDRCDSYIMGGERFNDEVYFDGDSIQAVLEQARRWFGTVPGLA